MSTLFTSYLYNECNETAVVKYFLNKSSTCRQGLTSQMGTLPSLGLTAELSLSLSSQSGLDGHQMDLPARLGYSGNAKSQGIEETSKTGPDPNPLNHLALTTLLPPLEHPFGSTGNGQHL